MSQRPLIDRYININDQPRVEYKMRRNPARSEVFSMVLHENLALPVEEIGKDKEYDYFIFKDFEPVNVEELTDEARFDIMCQFQNLFAFLESNGYQVTGIDMEDVAILKNDDPEKDNHLLVHNLEVKKPKYFRPDNDYMIAKCAEMLGNSKIRGELRPCRRMKTAYVIKKKKYIEIISKFNK